MKVVFLFAITLATIWADMPLKKPHHYNSAVNDEMVQGIRSKSPTWQAYEPGENPLRNYTDAQLKYLSSMPKVDYEGHMKKLAETQETIKHLFASPDSDKKLKASPEERLRAVTLPTNYDWRTTDDGKRCTPKVQSQGSCGSCYAFATAIVFAARYCQVRTGAAVIDYSPQDLLTCSVRTSGCDGGLFEEALTYLEEYGITTLACKPYLEMNSPSDATPKQRCVSTKCASGDPIGKSYCKKGTSIVLYGKDRIKYEITQRGPIGTAMIVYDDLMSYKSGIYKSVQGAKQGGHAIVLFGWGLDTSVTPNIEYWLVMNTWGDDWGESGYFRIDMTDTRSQLGEAGYYCIPEVA